MSLRIRSYSELRRLETFKERFDYLRLVGVVGQATFGFDRHINQMLYKSYRWRKIRDEIIIRDEGCDLGVPGYEIEYGLLVHHINPLTLEDIEEERTIVFDPNNLITTTHNTHMAIHYGNESLLPKSLVIRRPGDTTLWR